MYYHKIEITLAALIILTGNEIVGILLSISGIIYYLAMLKLNVVDKKNNGSWIDFIKSMINHIKHNR